jgi:hypothetical protein
MAEELNPDWFERLPCAITVCDDDYTVLYLNRRAAEVNAADGGKELVGRNLLSCHPARARSKLRAVMAGASPNVYTVDKNGVRKVVFQAHWRRGGRQAGLVEVTFELPYDAAHFVRSSDPPAPPSVPTVHRSRAW